MNGLVLGATGYVGSRLLAMLRDTDWAKPMGASSRARGDGHLRLDTRRGAALGAGGPGRGPLRLDTRAGAALAEALRGMDAVINCVAGDAPSIGLGARMLAQA